MAFYIGIPSINIRTLRYLQEEYCERECPDCEGAILPFTMMGIATG